MRKLFHTVMSYFCMFLIGGYTYGHFVGESQEVTLLQWIVVILGFIFFIIESRSE